MGDKYNVYDYQEWFFGGYKGFKGFLFNEHRVDYGECYFGCEETLEKVFYI